MGQQAVAARLLHRHHHSAGDTTAVLALNKFSAAETCEALDHVADALRCAFS